MLTTVRSFQGIARRCNLERALETVTCLLAPSCYPCPGTAPSLFTDSGILNLEGQGIFGNRDEEEA
jgi:hypothetical protein